MPVCKTGTVEFITALFMSRAPPRGTMRSMYSRSLSMRSTVSWLGSSTRQTASGVTPLASSDSRMTRTSAAFDSYAEELPRRSIALPALKASAAASTVTFGLAS